MFHIRSDIEIAKHFESFIEEDRFELILPRKFSLVCFRLRPVNSKGDADEVNKKKLEAVNSSGRAYMTHAIIGGKFTMCHWWDFD